jgi:molybdate transport system substrate-binding protein
MLKLLSGGAAQAVVDRMKPRFGTPIEGTFGAVGAMRDKLLAGEACDVVILSQALIDDLANQGHVVRDTAVPLGAVKTGVAIRQGDPAPDISTRDALRAALEHAPGIYFPDPQKATAGIHFMKVLQALGIAESHKGHLRTFPNGQAAMGEMARAPVPGVIGCTQVTEILYTPGVRLIGLLPPEFELATVYTAAVCTKAASPDAARKFIRLIAGAEGAAVRAEAGFA